MFRVLDAMKGPHSGHILRLRVQSGEAPTIRALRGATLKATSPEGSTATVKVTGFSITGGKASNDRLARTGRIDVHVEEVDGDGPVGIQWEAVLA